MNGHRRAAVAASITALLLAGCAASPEVDLGAAREWVETVEAEESDGPGAAGTASMQIPRESDDVEPAATGFDFDAPTQLKRADVRCYGDGTADLTLTVTSSAGESEAFTAQIPCDQESHGLDVDAGPASTALIEAVGSAETYLHVTLIEEMVVER